MMTAAFLAGGLAALASQSAGGSARTIKGLEVTASSVTRAKRVSLQDCPPGENSVRGVIRPNETTEFVTVRIDVSVGPSFSSVEIAKPLLYDEEGNEYKTAQSFRELSASPSYSCDFSFRVPEGAKIVRFVIEEASFDLGALGN